MKKQTTSLKKDKISQSARIQLIARETKVYFHGLAFDSNPEDSCYFEAIHFASTFDNESIRLVKL